MPEKHTCCFDSPKRFIDAIIGYQGFTDEPSEKHFAPSNFAISISVQAAIVTIVAIVLSYLFDFKVRTDR